MKMYYKTDGDHGNYPGIFITENKKILAYWLYKDEKWEFYTHPARVKDFNPSPYRISKKEAERIMFLDSI